MEANLKDAYRARYGHRYRELSASHGQATAEAGRPQPGVRSDATRTGGVQHCSVDGLRRRRPRASSSTTCRRSASTLRDERERLAEAQSQAATAITR
ncbi:MAG: hypothetical protein WKG07_13015 [Hymenobacter sp.]